MIKQGLFKQIDNSQLIVFRVFFGLLITLEAFGAIATGWVKRTLVEPDFTFSFIGFEWLQPLPGNGMYFYFAAMGILGLGVMLGYKYRWSIIGFTVLWSGAYFMQKASYNNHYYLLIILSAIMCFLPANRCYALDAKHKPSTAKISMPQWCRYVLIVQMAIVYTYAAVAKMYPDWLDTSVVQILLEGKKHYYIIGDFLQHKPVHYMVAYGGLLFDLLVVPFLLWRRTRKWAFMLGVFFHLFNSIVFQVGIFPYMSIALCIFFFDPETIHRIFLKKKPFYNDAQIEVPPYKNVLLTVFAIHFMVQLVSPLRHWVITDPVLWTEEGHRLSWRMMLRTKSGQTTFKVINNDTGERIPIQLNTFLSRKQRGLVHTKPDVIWQFSQRLKSIFEAKGIPVSVFVECSISVNRKPYQQLIDPNVDLTKVKWDAFQHSDWILPAKQVQVSD